MSISQHQTVARVISYKNCKLGYFVEEEIFNKQISQNYFRNDSQEEELYAKI